MELGRGRWRSAPTSPIEQGYGWHDVLLWTIDQPILLLLRPLALRLSTDRDVCHRQISMSPTVFRDGPFRFFFFSREEERLHIHVQAPDGEAKFWIEPEIQLARNYQLSPQDLSRALQLVIDHEQEIRDAWQRHFGR